VIAPTASAWKGNSGIPPPLLVVDELGEVTAVIEEVLVDDVLD